MKLLWKNCGLAEEAQDLEMSTSVTQTGDAVEDLSVLDSHRPVDSNL